MYQISKYENCKTPTVSLEYGLDRLLHSIKNGDPAYLPTIKKARTYPKGDSNYSIIKEQELPTHRFNFLFKDYASNKNIIAPTGLIYIDADDVEVIPYHDLIYAKWRSLSNSGFSLLVKVDNLTLGNFSQTYDQISLNLNLNSDIHARKPNQQTVLSYDPNLYYNPDSVTYSASTDLLENKKVSNHTIQKREECIDRDDTFSQTIRFNNISDYFNKGEDVYRVFESKVSICDPFIPRRIELGKRDSTLFFLLSQYQLLNPFAGYNFLISMARTINDKMSPPLASNQLKKTVASVIKMNEGEELQWHFNSNRRILFNPIHKLTRKEKMEIVNKEMGRLKVNGSKQKIYDAIETWDFSSLGKITQKSVSIWSGLSLPTVKRHWADFKLYVSELNNPEILSEHYSMLPNH